jgi:hypothetical protein
VLYDTTEAATCESEGNTTVYRKGQCIKHVMQIAAFGVQQVVETCVVTYSRQQKQLQLLPVGLPLRGLHP